MSDFFSATYCLGCNSLGNSSRSNDAPATGKGAAMKTTINKWATRIFGKLRELGPYLAIELVLPGGSLLALGLWLYNRKHARA
jgi:hypothetical protein